MEPAEPLEPNEDQGNEAEAVIEAMVPTERLGGLYSDFARINHDEHGFTLDFFAMEKLEDPPQAVLQARIRLSHRHAVSLSRALKENVARWAAKEIPARDKELGSLQNIAEEGDAG